MKTTTTVDINPYYALQTVTCSIGRGISLNKKRRKNQKRFYNVQCKRSRTCVEGPHDTVIPAESELITPVPDKTLDVEEINQPTGSTIENKEKHLLHTYLEHQDAMKVQAKTVAALKEKHTSPSKRTQMFELMKEKGLYKKFPNKEFSNFKSWLQSPSGGQLKCPGEIVSEISRYVPPSPSLPPAIKYKIV